MQIVSPWYFQKTSRKTLDSGGWTAFQKTLPYLMLSVFRTIKSFFFNILYYCPLIFYHNLSKADCKVLHYVCEHKNTGKQNFGFCQANFKQTTYTSRFCCNEHFTLHNTSLRHVYLNVLEWTNDWSHCIYIACLPSCKYLGPVSWTSMLRSSIYSQLPRRWTSSFFPQESCSAQTMPSFLP